MNYRQTEKVVHLSDGELGTSQSRSRSWATLSSSLSPNVGHLSKIWLKQNQSWNIWHCDTSLEQRKIKLRNHKKEFRFIYSLYVITNTKLFQQIKTLLPFSQWRIMDRRLNMRFTVPGASNEKSIFCQSYSFRQQFEFQNDILELHVVLAK